MGDSIQAVLYGGSVSVLIAAAFVLFGYLGRR